MIEKLVNIIPFRLRSYIKDIPVISYLQRLFFKHFYSNKKFLYVSNAGPSKGVKFLISLPEDKNIWTGTYELNFTNHLINNLKLGDVCYDIGGYKGFFSGVFAVNGASVVYLFEPLHENIKKIKEFLYYNPTLPIILNEVAISDKVGETIFKVLQNGSMGKISESTFEAEESIKSIIVNTETIDNLIQNSNYPHPNLIKIDVEGAEEYVLQGAEKCITEFTPTLLIEIHSHEIGKRCYDFLFRKGYDCLVIETQKKPDFISELPVSHYLCIFHGKK